MLKNVVWRKSTKSSFPTELKQQKLAIDSQFYKFFVGWAIPRCISTTPHPIVGQGGGILLVHCSMIILKPAILVFNGSSEVRSIL